MQVSALCHQAPLAYAACFTQAVMAELYDPSPSGTDKVVLTGKRECGEELPRYVKAALYGLFGAAVGTGLGALGGGALGAGIFGWAGMVLLGVSGAVVGGVAGLCIGVEKALGSK
jgi:hypothetical protein